MCSWLADSWAWALSASEKPRIVLSSLTRARNSVWSRRVTTVPNRCPAHLAGRLVDHHDPVIGQEDLVGTLCTRRERGAEGVGQPDVVDPAARSVVGQGQEPVGLVVEELEPALAVEEQESLTHGVQHRVVVLVHPPELGGAQIVRGAA